MEHFVYLLHSGHVSLTLYRNLSLTYHEMRNSSKVLAEERNRDLLRAVREVVRDYNIESQHEAIAMAIKRPSSRFWVTARATELALYRIAKGDMLIEMRPTSRAKFFDLYSIYLSVRDKEEFKGKTIHYISEVICEYPAPEFYLTKRSAMAMYMRQRKIEQERRIAQLLRFRS